MPRFESWTPDGRSTQAAARQVLRAVVGLHGTWQEEVWLWRGQSRANWRLEAGIHTRLRESGYALTDGNVGLVTEQLLSLARARGLDKVESLSLPDLALLAHLQHHGAATPLLDVTVDPFVAIWMAVNANAADPSADDSQTANVFAIRRPPPDYWLDPLDSRPYWDSASTPMGVRGDLAGAFARNREDAETHIYWYRPPDISERLRIQRGSFILGSVRDHNSVTFILDSDADSGWLAHRISKIGKSGSPPKARTDVVAFRITPRLKADIRLWLAERAGLTLDAVFPTPWHNPFLEQFARTYGRERPLEPDLGR